MILIKEAETFSPQPLGSQDILCGGRSILAVEKGSSCSEARRI